MLHESGLKVCVGWWWWCKPILLFSFGFDQAERHSVIFLKLILRPPLCRALSDRYPHHSVILAVDEVWAYKAKKTGSGQFYDWTDLQDLPHNIHLIMAFNPNMGLPVKLPAEEICLQFQGNIRYRNTRKIIKFCNFISNKLGLIMPEDEVASDVDGESVGWLDLGEITSHDEIRAALARVARFMGPGPTTFLCGYGLDALHPVISDYEDKTGEWNAMMSGEYQGHETDRVVYLGSGAIMEPLSRARVRLCVLTCHGLGSDKEWYDLAKPWYTGAMEEGLVVCVE
jgi:hypothetical protein